MIVDKRKEGNRYTSTSGNELKNQAILSQQLKIQLNCMSRGQQTFHSNLLIVAFKKL